MRQNLLVCAGVHSSWLEKEMSGWSFYHNDEKISNLCYAWRVTGIGRLRNQEAFQLRCECALVFPSVYPGSHCAPSWLCLAACFCMCLSPFYHFLNVSFPLNWSPSLSCSSPSLLSLPHPPSLSLSLKPIISSLQNLALALPIPDGLTYITHFTVTL